MGWARNFPTIIYRLYLFVLPEKEGSRSAITTTISNLKQYKKVSKLLQYHQQCYDLEDRYTNTIAKGFYLVYLCYNN